MDEAAPRAEALVLRGREIADVGSASESPALKASGTRVIDTGGGTVLPGFIAGRVTFEG
jgi:predicted amidohydrolase YtcJ